VRPDCPLTYEIIVNWVIAEHKSQGLLQTEAGKHDREEFWVFRASGPAANGSHRSAIRASGIRHSCTVAAFVVHS